MKRKKIELEEKLLSWLLELQKALEEVSDAQEKLASAQSKIFSLWEQIDRGCSGKIELEREIRVLRGSLGSRDKDVEELRTEVSACQIVMMIFGLFTRHCWRRLRSYILRL